MRNRKIDLLRAGTRKGRWTILSKADEDGSKEAMWLCRCECGTVRRVSAHSLAQGTSKSCGCLRTERLAQYNMSPKKSFKGGRVILAYCDDEFELPLAVADTIPEMSRILGVSYSTVIRCLGEGTRRVNVKGAGWCRVMYVYI